MAMNRNDIQSVMCGHRHVKYTIDQNLQSGWRYTIEQDLHNGWRYLTYTRIKSWELRYHEHWHDQGGSIWSIVYIQLLWRSWSIVYLQPYGDHGPLYIFIMEMLIYVYCFLAMTTYVISCIMPIHGHCTLMYLGLLHVFAIMCRDVSLYYADWVAGLRLGILHHSTSGMDL